MSTCKYTSVFDISEREPETPRLRFQIGNRARVLHTAHPSGHTFRHKGCCKVGCLSRSAFRMEIAISGNVAEYESAGLFFQGRICERNSPSSAQVRWECLRVKRGEAARSGISKED